MKVFNLTENSDVYTSNVYLVTGNFNALSDVNTLIDVGRDEKVTEKIYTIATGVGKKRIEQVILTHIHYDHSGMLLNIKKEFNPLVYAYSSNFENVDKVLKDEDILKIGDRQFEVIHVTVHSNDSICLYNEEEQVLFSGDTPLDINTSEGTYDSQFVEVLENLVSKKISTIYLGHGKPILNNCREILQKTLENVRLGLKNY